MPDVDADIPGLLEAMAVFGAPTSLAPGLLDMGPGAALPRGRAGRRERFRAAIRACRSASVEQMSMDPGDQRHVRFAQFEALDRNVRTAMFLIAVLGFNLHDTAFILDREAFSLAMAVEDGLDQLESGPSRPPKSLPN